jgi:photosystem II stability/assembly factor-like uncharacterized protein
VVLVVGLLFAGGCSGGDDGAPDAPVGGRGGSGGNGGGGSGGSDAGAGSGGSGGAAGNDAAVDRAADGPPADGPPADGPPADGPPPDTGPPLACGSGAVSEPPVKGPAAAATDADQTFRSLTVDPTNPAIVFVGSEGNGVFRSTDSGQTWTWLRKGLRHEGFQVYAEVWDIAVAPSRPTTVYAATTDSPGPPSGPYPSSRAGVYRSDDRGDSWRQVGCTLANSKAAVLLADPGNADTLIVGFEGGAPSFSNPPASFFAGGFWRTTDGGATWATIALPATGERNGFWRLRRRGSALYTFGVPAREAPMTGLGLLRADGGGAFVQLPMPFANLVVDGWDVSADGAIVLVQPRDTFKLHRSTNGGASFAEVPGLTAPAHGYLTMAPGTPAQVLYVSAQALYRSTDSLATATKVLDAAGWIEDIEFAASDPQVVYAAARGLHVYRSADAGATWTRVASLRQDVIDK